jgi:hypothetical protein
VQPERNLPTHNVRRNWFRLAALAGVFALAPAFASTYPVCPPAPGEPVSWDGQPPIRVDRDIESCRIFFVEPWQEPGFVLYFFHELTPADIQHWVDIGARVVMTDQLVAGAKTEVIEYLNTGLNHYFLALPEESGAIERGDAGPGWVRTGYGFTARSVTYSPFPDTLAYYSPISSVVYRFYGSIHPGPNSHFFTIDRAEASSLVNIARVTPADQLRWNLEKYAFNAFRVQAGNTCAANQVPVWRAFNRGPERGVESNHRFSTDKSVIDGMVSQGWIMEGIVFCVDAAA